MRKVVWNKVTRFSQGVAIILGLAIFVVGFWCGSVYQAVQTYSASTTP